MNRAFLRFLIVGLLNTCVGLAMMFSLLIVLKQDYWVSTFIGNTVGAVVSFVLNRRYTFQSDASVIMSGIRFFVVMFICYLISYRTGLWFVHVMLLSIHTIPTSAVDRCAGLSGMIVYTLTNYIGQKYVVFPKKKTDMSLSEG